MLESPWRDFGVIPAAIWGRFGGAFSSLIVPHLLHNRLPAHNLPPSRSNSLPHNILFSSLRANPPSHDCSPHRSSSAAPLLPHEPRSSILDLRAIRTTPFLAPSLLPCVAAHQNKANQSQSSPTKTPPALSDQSSHPKPAHIFLTKQSQTHLALSPTRRFAHSPIRPTKPSAQHTIRHSSLEILSSFGFRHSSLAHAPTLPAHQPSSRLQSSSGPTIENSPHAGR